MCWQQGDGHLSQAERLALAVRRHGIPVLLVHGASDALVPLANSRRLATLLEAEVCVCVCVEQGGVPFGVAVH